MRIIGYQKDNLRNSMEITTQIISLIADLQQDNPNFLLCGSCALILNGLLENRDVSDIDFVTNHISIQDCKLSLVKDTYSDLNKEDGYMSFSCHSISNGYDYKINVLVFEDTIELNSENLSFLNIFNIKQQKLEDIINWKEKYNRPKDIMDLENITLRAIEKAML